MSRYLIPALATDWRIARSRKYPVKDALEINCITDWMLSVIEKSWVPTRANYFVTESGLSLSGTGHPTPNCMYEFVRAYNDINSFG
jgi:hypothetical protein